MLPIPIAINLITSSSSSSSFHFNSSTHHHDHQTSQAIKSLLTACYTNQQLSDQVMSSIITSRKTAVNEFVKTGLSHLCFYVFTVAGNEDVFLMEDEEGENNNSSSISSAEKRRRASIHFLSGFYPTILNSISDKNTEDVMEIFEFLDSLFDLWFSNISFFGKALTSSYELKKRINGFFHDCLKFIARSLLLVFDENNNNLSLSSSLKLTVLMTCAQLLRLISTMYLSFPSAFPSSTASASNLVSVVDDDEDQEKITTARDDLSLLLERSNFARTNNNDRSSTEQKDFSISPSDFSLVISETLKAFKKTMIENFEPSFRFSVRDANDDDDGWSLFRQGIDCILVYLKSEQNLTLLASTCLRACESLIQGSNINTNGDDDFQNICNECFKRWKEFFTSQGNNNNDNNMNNISSFSFAFDSLKLGLVCGGDVGIRVFGCCSPSPTNASTSLYSNQRSLLNEALDTLIRMLENVSTSNNNDEDRTMMSLLLLNLLICFGTPITLRGLIVGTSTKNASDNGVHSSSFFPECHLNIDHLEKLLNIYYSSCQKGQEQRHQNNSQLEKLICLILLSKPQVGVSSLFKKSQDSEHSLSIPTRRILNVLKKLFSEIVLDKDSAHHLLENTTNISERICRELLKVLSASETDPSFSEINKELTEWIQMIDDDQQEQVKKDFRRQQSALLLSNINKNSEMSYELFFNELLRENKNDTDESGAIIVESIMNVISSLDVSSDLNLTMMSTTSTATTLPDDHNYFSPKVSKFSTPSDIAANLSIVPSNVNNNNDVKTKKEKTKENMEKFRSALGNWIEESVRVNHPQLESHLLIQFMKQGVLKFPGSPTIVSFLSSFEFSSSQNAETDELFTCFFNEILDFPTSPSASNLQHQSIQHSFIAPLICLKLFSSATCKTSGIIKLIHEKVLQKVQNKGDKSLLVENINDNNNDDQLFSLRDAWKSFPEIRKIIAEILTTCCFGKRSSVNFENVESLTIIICDFFKNCPQDQQFDDEILMRFYLLLSCQIILFSIDDTNNNNLKISNSAKDAAEKTKRVTFWTCIRNISHEVAKSCSRLLKEKYQDEGSEENNDNNTNSLLFNACTDSLSISLLGCLACRYQDGALFDRCVQEWMALDKSFYDDGIDDTEKNEIMQNFLIPIAQHSTAKSLILLIQRKLLHFENNNNNGCFFSNSAQVWNALGPTLSLSLHYSLQIATSKTLTNPQEKEMLEFKSEMQQKAYTLSIQLISCISVLSSMCVKQKYEFNFGQCLFDSLSIFSSSATARYPTIQIELDDVLFSSMVKMLASIVAAGVDRFNNDSNAGKPMKEDSSLNIFYLIHQIHTRECVKAVEILKKRQQSGKDKVYPEMKMMMEFLLEVLEKKEK